MTHTAHHRSYGASVSIKNFFSHKSHTAVRKWRFEHNINIPILSFFQPQSLCVQKLTLVKIFTSIFFWLLALTSASSASPCLSLSSTFAFVFGLCLQQLHPWSVTEEVISYISYIYIVILIGLCLVKTGFTSAAKIQLKRDVQKRPSFLYSKNFLSITFLQPFYSLDF